MKRQDTAVTASTVLADTLGRTLTISKHSIVNYRLSEVILVAACGRGILVATCVRKLFDDCVRAMNFGLRRARNFDDCNEGEEFWWLHVCEEFVVVACVRGILVTTCVRGIFMAEWVRGIFVTACVWGIFVTECVRGILVTAYIYIMKTIKYNTNIIVLSFLQMYYVQYSVK